MDILLSLSNAINVIVVIMERESAKYAKQVRNKTVFQYCDSPLISLWISSLSFYKQSFL